MSSMKFDKIKSIKGTLKSDVATTKSMSDSEINRNPLRKKQTTNILWQATANQSMSDQMIQHEVIRKNETKHKHFIPRRRQDRNQKYHRECQPTNPHRHPELYMLTITLSSTCAEESGVDAAEIQTVCTRVTKCLREKPRLSYFTCLGEASPDAQPFLPHSQSCSTSYSGHWAVTVASSATLQGHTHTQTYTNTQWKDLGCLHYTVFVHGEIQSIRVWQSNIHLSLSHSKYKWTFNL